MKLYNLPKSSLDRIHKLSGTLFGTLSCPEVNFKISDQNVKWFLHGPDLFLLAQIVRAGLPGLMWQSGDNVEPTHQKT